MKCKRVLSGLILSAICVSMTGALSGCGEKEVTVYKTDHDSGEWEISSMEELLLEENITPEKIAGKINDFCIYEGYYDNNKEKTIEEDYTARVPVSIDGNDSHFVIKLRFNADKEFQEWVNDDGYDLIGSMSDLEGSSCQKNWDKWYNVLEDTFGEPADTSNGKCRWEIEEKRIWLSVQSSDGVLGGISVRPNVLYRP